jgi:hypothetical protein
VSEEQQNEILGRTLQEHKAACKHLAALHAELERIGNYLDTAGYALRTNHNLWPGEYSGLSSGAVDLKFWPTADEVQRLIDQTIAAEREKNRLAAILKAAGFAQPE